MPAIKQSNKRKIDSTKCSIFDCTSCCSKINRKKSLEDSTIEITCSRDNVDDLKDSYTSIKEPFIEDLPQSLEPGTCISIKGFIEPECSRFSVNLAEGREDNSDIIVHINPRLSQRYVVRNSREKGRWGDEELTSVAKFVLARNGDFALNVVVAEHEFLVSVNGRHVCAFVFRAPLARAKVLRVEGAVRVDVVEYKKLEIYPQPGPQNSPHNVPLGGARAKVDTQQLDIPLTATLPEGFKHGWQLEIHGRVKILPYAFYINLQEGPQIWPHPTVPLHLNPRFSSAYGSHMFIRNCWLNGEWGDEERSPGYHFRPGQHFSLAIRKSDTFFSVWVDGKLVGEFIYRVPANKINTVYIHGDVVVKDIYMKDHIDDKYCIVFREDIKLSL